MVDIPDDATEDQKATGGYDPSAIDDALKVDIISRVDETIEYQIEGVRATVVRATEWLKIILIYSGLILTALTFVFRTGQIPSTYNTYVAIIPLGLGGLLLLIALILTILLHTGTMVTYSHVNLTPSGSSSYYDNILKGSADVMFRNQEIIAQRKQNSRRALTSLLNGIMFSIFGITFIVFDTNYRIQLVLLVVLAGLMGFLAWNILGGRFDRFSEF